MKVLCDNNLTEAPTLPDCWNAVECNYMAINQHLAPLSFSILWGLVTSNQNQSLLVYFWDRPGKTTALKINYEWWLMIARLGWLKFFFMNNSIIATSVCDLWLNITTLQAVTQHNGSEELWDTFKMKMKYKCGMVQRKQFSILYSASLL